MKLLPWQYLVVLVLVLVVAAAAFTAAWIALLKWQEGVIRREDAEEPHGFPVKPLNQKKGQGLR